VARGIGVLLDRLHPALCIFPLGLGDGASAREETSNAAMATLAERPWCEAVAYFDLPYAITWPSRVDERLSQLGKWNLLSYEPASLGAKKTAVLRYLSQHAQLSKSQPSWSECYVPGSERYMAIQLA
jgi:hypothetical protein